MAAPPPPPSDPPEGFPAPPAYPWSGSVSGVLPAPPVPLKLPPPPEPPASPLLFPPVPPPPPPVEVIVEKVESFPGIRVAEGPGPLLVAPPPPTITS